MGFDKNMGEGWFPIYKRSSYVVETVLVHIEFGRKGDDDNHDYPVYDNENMNSPYQHNFSKNKNIT